MAVSTVFGTVSFLLLTKTLNRKGIATHQWDDSASHARLPRKKDGPNAIVCLYIHKLVTTLLSADCSSEKFLLSAQKLNNLFVFVDRQL